MIFVIFHSMYDLFVCLTHMPRAGILKRIIVSTLIVSLHLYSIAS